MREGGGWGIARAVRWAALCVVAGCGDSGNAGPDASNAEPDAGREAHAGERALPPDDGGVDGSDPGDAAAAPPPSQLDDAAVPAEDASLPPEDGDETNMSPPPPLGTATIGSEGGAVALPSGAYVSIPEDALDDEVEITIREYDDPLDPPDGLRARGKAYAFEPHGLSFDVAVTIVLPYEGSTDDVVPLRLSDEDDDAWSVVPDSVPVGGILAFTTNRFSIYEPASADAGLVELCDGEVANLAEYVVRGEELIVDLDAHAANTDSNPFGATLLNSYVSQLSASFDWIERTPGCSGAGCYDQDELAAQVFVGSDTRDVVLGGLSYSLDASGGDSGTAVVTNTDMAEVADTLNQSFPGRALRTAVVMPNDRIDLQLAMMDDVANEVVAWRTTTAWPPGGGSGYFLDDVVGEDMIEKGLELGVPIFLVEKGMPLNGFDATHTDPRDVGPAAAAYPSARLIVLHAAFEHGFAAGENSRPEGDTVDVGWGEGVGEYPEGPYDPDDAEVQELYPLDRGVNSLITSLLDAGVGPGENVYVGLGGVFAQLMERPTEAAHVLGKLLLYVGEDNILWGTESVWYGGPTPQIEAFRDFEIPAELQEEYGYPELTRARKAKILGVNAARLFCLRP